MILKKPYAFLIKYFRIIHLIISLLLLYLVISTTGIVQFFNEFVSNGYYTYASNIAGSHINIFMYLSIIFILISVIAIYLLLRNKNKSRKLYLGIIIYYMILFIMLVLAYNVFQSLETSTMDASVARAIRDLSLLIYLPQYFFLFYMLFRTTGFDIKKFNFAKDLEELEIEAKDNEEFEFVIGLKGYKVKRGFRRMLRELIYYVKENAFILSCIAIVLGTVLGTTLFFRIQIYNKRYKANETFSYSSFNLRVRDSILSNVDYKGQAIDKEKYYLAVDILIQNRTTKSTNLNIKNFRLLVGDEIIYPTIDRGDYFVDLGVPYDGKEIAPNVIQDYVLVYELSEKQVKDTYTLQVVDQYVFNIGEMSARYKETKLKPKVLNELKQKDTVKLKEEVNLEDAFVKGKVTIEDYTITNSYKYKYDFCYQKKCIPSTGVISIDYQTSGSGATLLAMKYNLDLDRNNAYQIKNNKYFFSHFAQVRYKVGEEWRLANVKDKTPNDFKDIVVLQTTKEIATSDEVQLLLTIRDTRYTIVLKEKNED